MSSSDFSRAQDVAKRGCGLGLVDYPVDEKDETLRNRGDAEHMRQAYPDCAHSYPVFLACRTSVRIACVGEEDSEPAGCQRPKVPDVQKMQDSFWQAETN